MKIYENSPNIHNFSGKAFSILERRQALNVVYVMLGVFLHRIVNRARDSSWYFGYSIYRSLGARARDSDGKSARPKYICRAVALTICDTFITRVYRIYMRPPHGPQSLHDGGRHIDSTSEEQTNLHNNQKTCTCLVVCVCGICTELVRFSKSHAFGARTCGKSIYIYSS